MKSDLHFNEDESRVAVAGLQLLERDLARRLEASLPAESTGGTLGPQMEEVLTRHQMIANLTTKLSTVGAHTVDRGEIELAKQGLLRYVELLNHSVAEHELECDDFLLEPQLQARLAERMRGSKLLDRLGE
jgi:hypothetical protein